MARSRPAGASEHRHCRPRVFRRPPMDAPFGRQPRLDPPGTIPFPADRDRADSGDTAPHRAPTEVYRSSVCCHQAGHDHHRLPSSSLAYHRGRNTAGRDCDQSRPHRAAAQPAAHPDVVARGGAASSRRVAFFRRPGHWTTGNGHRRRIGSGWSGRRPCRPKHSRELHRWDQFVCRPTCPCR